jgi:DNA replication protein DnaC
VVEDEGAVQVIERARRSWQKFPQCIRRKQLSKNNSRHFQWRANQTYGRCVKVSQRSDNARRELCSQLSFASWWMQARSENLIFYGAVARRIRIAALRLQV